MLVMYVLQHKIFSAGNKNFLLYNLTVAEPLKYYLLLSNPQDHRPAHNRPLSNPSPETRKMIYSLQTHLSEIRFNIILPLSQTPITCISMQSVATLVLLHAEQTVRPLPNSEIIAQNIFMFIVPCIIIYSMK